MRTLRPATGQGTVVHTQVLESGIAWTRATATASRTARSRGDMVKLIDREMYSFSFFILDAEEEKKKCKPVSGLFQIINEIDS